MIDGRSSLLKSKVKVIGYIFLRWRDRRRGKKEIGCRGKKKRKGCKKGKENRWRKCDRMEGWIKIDVKSGREKEWEVGEKTLYPSHQRFRKQIPL